MKSIKLAISEIFFSIQGEGKTVGIPSVFVRLGGCNLICGGEGTQNDKKLHNNAKWRCDTIEVWRKSKSINIHSILDIKYINQLKKGAHLIITGGEPLIQQENLILFLNYIKKITGCYIEIETNGTIIPNKKLLELVDLFNCSPKLSSSGNKKDDCIVPQALKAINSKSRDSIFKFVVSENKDLNEILKDFNKYISRERIWLMPAGENQKYLNKNRKKVIDICKKENFKFSNRLQIDIWNQKTGV